MAMPRRGNQEGRIGSASEVARDRTPLLARMNEASTLDPDRAPAPHVPLLQNVSIAVVSRLHGRQEARRDPLPPLSPSQQTRAGTVGSPSSRAPAVRQQPIALPSANHRQERRQPDHEVP